MKIIELEVINLVQGDSDLLHRNHDINFNIKAVLLYFWVQFSDTFHVSIWKFT